MTCKHDWHFIEGTDRLRCARCGEETGPRTPDQLMQDLLADVTLFGMAWQKGGKRIDPREVYRVPTETVGPYTIHGPTAPPAIHFYGGEAKTEILRLSKDGIWANPDIPCDEAAKKVLEAIDGYVKLMVEKAVLAAQAWIPVAERLPKPGQYVLAVFRYSTGKQVVIRAMHAPPKTLSEEDYGEFVTEGTDYDEATDTTYWPEGWYECNENEETHWQVHEEVTHWMPLPEVP